jgi:hypothetical protein
MSLSDSGRAHRRFVLLASAVLAAFAMLCTTSEAADPKTYKVSVCHSNPATGNTGIGTGWTSAADSHLTATVDCPDNAPGNGLRLNTLVGGPSSVYESAHHTFTAPQDTTITHVSHSLGLHRNHTNLYGLVVAKGGATPIEFNASNALWAIFHTVGPVPYSSGPNTVVVKPNDRQIAWWVYCGYGQGCPNDEGAASLSVQDLDLTISDPLAPTHWQAPSGSIWTDAWQRGIGDLRVRGNDSTGISNTSVLAGDDVVASQDEECDFTNAAPCPPTTDRTFDSITLPEGTYELVARVTDTPGWTDDRTMQVKVDRTAPAAPELTLAGSTSWRAVNDFDIQWEPEATGDTAPIEAAIWQLCRAGGDCEPEQTTSATGIHELENISVPERGEWELRVALRDAAGNTGPQSEPIRLGFDDRAPATPTNLEVLNGSDWAPRNAFVFWWDPATSEPLAPVSAVRWQRCPLGETTDCEEHTVEGDLTRLDFNDTVPVPGPGAYELRVARISAAGVQSKFSDPVVFRSDTTVPGAIEAEDIGWTRQERVSQVFRLAPDAPVGPSGILGYRVTTDGSEPDTWSPLESGESPEWDWRAPEGEHTVRVRAVSGAGVPSDEVASFRVRVDRTGPTATLDRAADDRSRTVVFTVEDPLSGVDPTSVVAEFKTPQSWEPLQGGTFDETTGRLKAELPESLIADREVTVRIRLRAQDRAGNTSTVAQDDNGTPLKATIAARPRDPSDPTDPSEPTGPAEPTSPAGPAPPPTDAAPAGATGPGGAPQPSGTTEPSAPNRPSNPNDLSQLPGSRVAPERCVRVVGLPIALAGARTTQIVIRGGSAVTNQSPLRLSLSKTSGVRSVAWTVGGLSAGSSRTAPFTVSVKPRQLKTTRDDRLAIRATVRDTAGRTLQIDAQVRVAACPRLSSRRTAGRRIIQRIDSRTALRAVSFRVPTWTLDPPRAEWRRFGQLRFLTADGKWHTVPLSLDDTGSNLTPSGARPRVVIGRDRINVDRLPPRVGVVELSYIAPSGQRFNERR